LKTGEPLDPGRVSVVYWRRCSKRFTTWFAVSAICLAPPEVLDVDIRSKKAVQKLTACHLGRYADQVGEAGVLDLDNAQRLQCSKSLVLSLSL
jgi:hypothetical protein